MNKVRVYIPLLYLLLSLCTQSKVYAQDPYEDTELRMGVSTDFKIVKKLKASAEVQMRSSYNYDFAKSVVFEGGLQYKLLDNFKIYADYRYTYSADFFSKSRVTLKAKYAAKIMKRTELGLGLKYQTDYNQLKKFEDVVFLDDQLLRPKLEIRYKIKKRKIFPYTAIEGFYHLYYKGNQFEEIRFYIGTELELSKKHSIDLSYVRSWEMNVKNLLNRHIINMGYHYSF